MQIAWGKPWHELADLANWDGVAAINCPGVTTKRLQAAGFGYARRFAAKEAAAKALGTGFRSGVFWRDLGVVNLPSGQPGLRLTGGALKRLEAMTPPGMTARLDVTLTDEPPLAQAVVIITALPAVIPAAVPAE